MKQNVLDHHSAFVEVAREISRLTDTARALRDLAAVPSDAVDALLADAELGAAEAKRAMTKTNDGDVARRRETASLASFADDETKRGPDGVRVSDAAAALKIQAELETLVAQRAPHAALDAAKRATFFAETLRASAASSRGRRRPGATTKPRRRKTQTPPFPKTPFQKTTPPPRAAAFTAAAGARRAATAMLAEMAREEEPFDTLETLGVPVSAREPTRAVSRETKNGGEGNAIKKNVSSVCVSRRAAAVFVFGADGRVRRGRGASRVRRARGRVFPRRARGRRSGRARVLDRDPVAGEPSRRVRVLPGGGGPRSRWRRARRFRRRARARRRARRRGRGGTGPRRRRRRRSCGPRPRRRCRSRGTRRTPSRMRSPRGAFRSRIVATRVSRRTPGDAGRERTRARDAFWRVATRAGRLLRARRRTRGDGAGISRCRRAAARLRARGAQELPGEASVRGHRRGGALDARAEALLRAYLDGAGDEAADALRAFAVL